jgi:tRNA A-37 threonylcarbamoyl transferase component Bud32
MVVGDVLSDRYELEELLGTGGMSSVYRAHDRLLERKVALKVLHQHFTADEEYVERFRREARAVATLSHPNIVTVIDRGENEGRQFIVFEYVEGENLKQLIQRRGAAPVATALELAMQIARGLSFAHQQGLIHRDVKPQNVLMNGDGQAKVTDFGIARSLDVKHGMTQTGTVLGTSDYIAPEQAQGQRVDEHTDVYSLGVVLYEMLLNEVPFPGENFVAIAMRHINEEPPSIRDKRPDVPPRVEAAVHRAMAKDPEARFQTMADFCRELEACLAEVQGTQVAVPVVKPRRARPPRRGMSPWPLILVLLALMAIGVVVAYLIVQGIPSWGITGVRSGGGGSGGGTAAAVHLRAVTAYDPFGSPPGQEHNADAPKATDKNSASYWETERYNSSFAAIRKKGVGLVLDAGKAVQLQQFGFSTQTPGFTAVLRAGDSQGGPFPDYLSAPTLSQAETRFTLSGTVKHRFYLIWITSLPPRNGTVRINEVSAS